MAGDVASHSSEGRNLIDTARARSYVPREPHERADPRCPRACDELQGSLLPAGSAANAGFVWAENYWD
jgi:hypothetical protein